MTTYFYLKTSTNHNDVSLLIALNFYDIHTSKSFVSFTWNIIMKYKDQKINFTVNYIQQQKQKWIDQNKCVPMEAIFDYILDLSG